MSAVHTALQLACWIIPFRVFCTGISGHVPEIKSAEIEIPSMKGPENTEELLNFFVSVQESPQAQVFHSIYLCLSHSNIHVPDHCLTITVLLG
jgi:hypothetical protein